MNGASTVHMPLQKLTEGLTVTDDDDDDDVGALFIAFITLVKYRCFQLNLIQV